LSYNYQQTHHPYGMPQNAVVVPPTPMHQYYGSAGHPPQFVGSLPNDVAGSSNYQENQATYSGNKKIK
jgi:hypothetical protein